MYIEIVYFVFGKIGYKMVSVRIGFGRLGEYLYKFSCFMFCFGSSRVKVVR